MTFKQALDFVLTEEGEETNDPKDPGGHTKYGISKKAYPNLNIAALTVDDAAEIYYRDYWAKLPTLPDVVHFLAFDCAVNCGTRRAIRILQLAIGAKDDGRWGPKSQAALEKKPLQELIINYQAERARFYALLDDLDDIYARGWMRRTMRAFFHAIQD
ncbi:MAG: glycoside hydrolase family 108 protein [Spongiibacteraceae bacterium]